MRKRRHQAACLGTGLGLFGALAQPATAGTDFSVRQGYEGVNQAAGQVPGLADDTWDFATVQGSMNTVVETPLGQYGVALLGNGGVAAEQQARFGDVTLKPQAKLDLGWQVHHVEVTGSLSYDSTGLDRRPLAEQWDNTVLTPAERQRYRYASVATDHYFMVGPRTSIVAYYFGSFLDRELKVKVESAGGYGEYEATPRLRLRLGGVDQRYEYGPSVIGTSGPELGAAYDVREGLQVEGKVGFLTLVDDNGPSQTESDYLAVRAEGATSSARASWTRGINERSAGTALTTSDVYTLSAKTQLDSHESLELAANARHEDWVKGFDDGTPADSIAGELKYVYRQGGDLPARPGESPLALTAAVSAEELQVKSGQTAQRQVLRLGVEERF